MQESDAIINELLRESKFYNIHGLSIYIQTTQGKKQKKKAEELTHEKQYKLCVGVSLKEMENVFNKLTGSEGFDFENWQYIPPFKKTKINVGKGMAGVVGRAQYSAPSFIMLFSKKLSRAEVRLLDRLTNVDRN